MLKTLESPHPREVPFFVESSSGGKVESISALPEKGTMISEASQPVVSDQKPNTPEHSPDTSPIQAISGSKVEEKARQPVVLNPVPPQQVKQPQGDETASLTEGTITSKDAEGAVLPAVKSDVDLSTEKGAREPRPITPQPASTENTMQNRVIETTQSHVDNVGSVILSSGIPKRCFTVKKVEDPVLNSSSLSEVKSGNKETEPCSAVNNSSSTDTGSQTEVVCNKSNKDISTQPETRPKLEPCGEALSPADLQGKKSLSSLQHGTDDVTNSKQDSSNVQKSDIEPSTPVHPGGEQSQIHFEVHASKTNGEHLQLEIQSSSRPQTPTYGFHPVDSSISGEHASPNSLKFESQLSGEEINTDKQKPDSVTSSDDELTAHAPAEKSEAPSSMSEFVQGRFIVSVTSNRPETPSSDTSEQMKPATLQPVEITLQDVTAAVGSESVPSLTPSSSVESLNSVGSQPGVQNAHASSSSPQNILPDGQSSINMSTLLNKDHPRKNSGQMDLLNDAKIVRQEGEQSKQTGEQVQIRLNLS